MSSEKIHILLASDINYAAYYGVFLTSLFENNRDCSFVIHVFADESWNDRFKDQYKVLVEKYHSDIVFYQVDSSMVKGMPEIANSRMTLTTYYHLFAASILPDNVNKVIYMDGDMMVTGSIKDLWITPLDGYALAAVEDNCSLEDIHYERLQYEKKYGYLNTGVTYYNIEYMRTHHVVDQLLDYIRTKGERILWYDQDVLNAVLFDKWLHLPITYNFQIQYFLRCIWPTLPEQMRKNMMEVSESPVIVHWNGGYKPWKLSSYGFPYWKNWQHYRRLSPWRYSLKLESVKEILKFIAKTFNKKSRFYSRRNREMVEVAHNL